MVQCDERQVVLACGGEPQQRRAGEWRAAEGEGAPRLLTREPQRLGAPGRRRQTREVRETGPQVRQRRDLLHDLAAAFVKTGAQRLLAAGHRVQRRAEARNVEPAPQPHRHRDVVGGISRREAVEEPEALLSERGARGAPLAKARDRR